MPRLIKTDFHLHTCYSDNQDRMRPDEYVTLARQGGYAAIGFCDHHHNLTHASWRELRAAVESLASSDLLLATGYEATFVTGHMCVLNKTEFDGATALQCEQQMWSTANLRIVAHPDNNACAWRLPLPLGAAGIEIINGGQDLYSSRPTSPCNGLNTYQTYLLLNHPLAALAQSDCHRRLIFGRVWTGMWLDEDRPTTWETIYAAMAERRTFAAMGDITLHAWCEEGKGGQPLLRWQVSEGAEVTVYCTDHAVTRFDTHAPEGSYSPTANGHYWLLARRGLTWAVSSPMTVAWLPGDSRQVAATRAELLAEPLLQQEATALQWQLERIAACATSWAASTFPVQAYCDWLEAQLPQRWAEHEFVEEGTQLRRQALLRLQHSQSLAGAVLADVLRHHYRAQLGEGSGVHVALAAPNSGGAAQFTVDVPRTWSALSLSDLAGRPLAALAMPVDGERDPINGQRTRDQMVEIVTWLRSGEMHEYVLRNVALTLRGTAVSVSFDLYPAQLAWQAVAFPDLSAELETLRLDAGVTEFYVAIRMPQRYTILLQDDALADGTVVVVHEAGAEPHASQPLAPGFFAGTLAAADFLTGGLALQVS